MWRQCALPCRHIGATWRIRSNMCFLRPNWVHNPNGKSIGSAISAQLTAESPYTLQWAPLSLKIAHSLGGSWSPSNSRFLPRVWVHNPNGIMISSAISHRWLQTVPILYYGLPLSPKFPLFVGDLELHLTHGSTESSTQLASGLVQPFLHGSLVW